MWIFATHNKHFLISRNVDFECSHIGFMENYKFGNVAQCNRQCNLIAVCMPNENGIAHDESFHFKKQRLQQRLFIVFTHMHALMLQECGFRICPHGIVWASTTQQMLRYATCTKQCHIHAHAKAKSLLVTLIHVFISTQLNLQQCGFLVSTISIS